MTPIQSVSPHVSNVAPQRSVEPSAVGSAGAAAAGNGAAAASSISMESSNVTMVQSQVSSMLSSIGGGLENNQMLKMIIGLMILQALLGSKGGQEPQQMAAGMLLGMLEGAGSNVQTQMFSMHSATNIVQMQNHSSTLETSRAALTPTATEGDPDKTGANIDLSA